MNEAPYHRHAPQQLAFFGKIGADVSHEMRNVLSIIGEYAGLLADLLAAAEAGRPLDHARLKQLSDNIVGQVRKGTGTMERFSRFAHTTDEPTASFDLTALAEDVAALAQRHVALAGCKLEVQLPNRAIQVIGNPFGLQHAVFSAIGIMLELLEKGEPATLRLDTEGSMAVISISGNAAPGGDLSGRISQLSAAMSELKGTAGTSWKDKMLSLVLTVPIP